MKSSIPQNVFHVGSETSLTGHLNSSPSIKPTDRFLLRYNKDGSERQIDGSTLLEEMDRVCGSRDKGVVLMRMSIKKL